MNATVRNALISGGVVIFVSLVAFIGNAYLEGIRNNTAAIAEARQQFADAISELQRAQTRDETDIKALRERMDRLDKRLSPTP